MRRRDDRGSAAVEFIGIVPVLVLVTILCVEAFLLASSFSAAEKAARDAARAGSMGEDGSAAARASLPDWATVESIDRYGCDGVCYQVRIRVPLVVSGLTSDRVTVTREASMPDPFTVVGE